MRRVGLCLNVAAVALLGLLAPVAAGAQGDRASIVGVAQDSSGAMLPGVSVEAASPALIAGSRSVVTDGAGRYAVADLRPGVYTVTFTLPGFNTVKREGIVLEGAFAATVNASMAVGSVEETVTVTGASPVVDIQNSRTQLVVNQDVLQALPVMRSIQDQANLVPGVVSRSTSRGQILSDFYINSMAARGSTDQRIYFDGMGGGNMLLGGGTQAIAGGVNELGQAEMVYDVGSQSAESAVSGVRMDAIPKDGGNQFSGTWRAYGSSKKLQNGNLTDELRAQSITAVNQLDFNWDNNVAAGGPIRQNKAWYFAAFELNQFNILVANVFFADGRQADTGGHVKPNLTTRLTFQASEKDRVSFSYFNSTSLTDRYDFNATTTPEAGLRVNSPINYSGALKWTRTATSRLLLEVGQSMQASTYHWEYQPEVGIFEVAKTNASINLTSNASPTAPVENFNNSWSTVANVSYVTGSHALKTGISLVTGYGRTKVEPHGDIVRLTFLNNAQGIPTASSVTIRNSPVTAREELHPDLGMFVQDKWTIKRLTVTSGGRFDYLNAGVPDQSAPAGRFVPAREAAAISCLPCWKDWSVRLAGAYDLFGNGKTALKASIGKYLASMTLGRAEGSNPIRSTSETRSWTDRDGNGTALNTDGSAQYSEIGPAINVNFGLPAGGTRLDPDTPRPTNWETSVSLQHELLPGFSVTGGYYHRGFQNISLTRNLLADPDLHYTPFTITAPLDARLPGGGGEVITQYNLLPSRLGLSDSVSTFSTENTRVYDGVEVSVRGRLPRGGFLLGGITTERTATTDCDVANPNSRRFCDQAPPFRTLYKLSGAYTLPYELQLSGSLQAIPGASIASNFTYNSAFAGVALTGGGNRTVNLVEPDTMFYDYETQVDLRASRNFRFGRKRVQAFVDVFNLMNASTVALVNTTITTNPATNPWLRPLVIMQARRFQLGARFDF